MVIVLTRVTMTVWLSYLSCFPLIQSDPDLVTSSGERVGAKSGSNTVNLLYRGKFILSLNRGVIKSGGTKSVSNCIITSRAGDHYYICHVIYFKSGSPFRLHQQKLGFDDQYSCELELITPLDREHQEIVVVTILAADGANPPKTDTLTLNIKVKDVNDNIPEFTRDLYTPSVPEDAPVGTEVVRVHATDRDEGANSRISYSLEPRFNKEGLFGIDAESGVVVLAGRYYTASCSILPSYDYSSHIFCKRGLEHNKQHHVSLYMKNRLSLVKIRIGQFPEKSTVRLTVTVTDVNDNNPDIHVTFLAEDTNGDGLVSEANTPGDYVSHISVEDRDSGDNGDVSLKRTWVLPSEQDKSGTFPTKKINPIPSPHPTTIPSFSLPPKEYVFQFNISQISLFSPFSLSRQKKYVFQFNISQISLFSPDPPPRYNALSLTEETISLALHYLCHALEQDKSGTFPAKKINPIPSPHPTTIPSFSHPPKEYVFQFNISQISLFSPFSLSRQKSMFSSLISLKSPFSLPFLSPAKRNANGDGLVSEANSPGDYVSHISVEDRDSGDNGDVSLKLYAEGAPFELIKSAGSGYTVQVAGHLDREEQDVWKVWLEATDKGTPPRVTYRNITLRLLDYNDNTPTFSKPIYRCEVSEISDKGTDIVRVTATDSDIGVNSEIRYYLVSIVTKTADRSSPIRSTRYLKLFFNHTPRRVEPKQTTLKKYSVAEIYPGIYFFSVVCLEILMQNFIQRPM
eukprot:sb/3462422/